MANESKDRRYEANVKAALTVVFVALFAVAFIGLVTMLDNWANERNAEDEIKIATEAPAHPFYVLLIGSDSRKGTAVYTGKPREHAQVDQHADIMTLMRIDPAKRIITLVTVPRDTAVGEEGSKLNDALLNNDPNEVVQAVGDLTGVYADYYMMTSFMSFENLVNALGGVKVNVPKTVTVTDPATGKKVKVKAGKNRNLNGSEALVLARARQEYETDQDALRQVNVRNLERALITKILKMDGDFDVEHILAIIENDTKTNVDLASVGFVMLDFVGHADEVTIYDCTGPYVGDNRESDGLWVVPADREAWAQLMAVVNAGEDPSTVSLAPSFK